MPRLLRKAWSLMTGRNRISYKKRLDPYYLEVSSCQVTNLAPLFEKFLGRKTDGYFVEIGAYDGVSFSNSFGLAKAGWSGLLVEPISEFAAKARQNHACHPAVRIIELAVGPPGENEISIAKGSALTSANKALVKEYSQLEWSRNVPFEKEEPSAAITLDELLNQEGAPRNFDVLIVDVEGFESEVFQGFTLLTWRPKMMIVELSDTHPDLETTTLTDANLMLSILGQSYVVVYKDAVNTVFVSRQLYLQTFGIED